MAARALRPRATDTRYVVGKDVEANELVVSAAARGRRGRRGRGRRRAHGSRCRKCLAAGAARRPRGGEATLEVQVRHARPRAPRARAGGGGEGGVEVELDARDLGPRRASTPRSTPRPPRAGRPRPRPTAVSARRGADGDARPPPRRAARRARRGDAAAQSATAAGHNRSRRRRQRRRRRRRRARAVRGPARVCQVEPHCDGHRLYRRDITRESAVNW